MNGLKKIRKSTVILLIFMLFILIGIFGFSSENSEESGDTGLSATKVISEFIFFDYNDFTESEQTFLVNALNPFIRKLAHFSIYMTLGMTVYGLYLTLNLPEKIKIKKTLLALLTVFVFASFDEIHQYFVPGRSARFTDVLIDSSGALLGIAIIFVLVRAFKKSK